MVWSSLHMHQVMKHFDELLTSSTIILNNQSLVCVCLKSVLHYVILGQILLLQSRELLLTLLTIEPCLNSAWKEIWAQSKTGFSLTQRSSRAMAQYSTASMRSLCMHQPSGYWTPLMFSRMPSRIGQHPNTFFTRDTTTCLLQEAFLFCSAHYNGDFYLCHHH